MIGAAFIHSGQQAQLKDYSTAVFYGVYVKFEGYFSSFREWILWSPTDPRTVDTVDLTRRICSEEGEEWPIVGKEDGHRCLRFIKWPLHRQNDHI